MVGAICELPLFVRCKSVLIESDKANHIFKIFLFLVQSDVGSF